MSLGHDPGSVQAQTMWDRDGAGPLPPLLVLAGNFTEAGAVRTGSIAAFDLATGDWSPFGSGMNAPVFALAVAPNGDLIAGGAFTTAGGAAASRVARWNGSTWSQLGLGLDGTVFDLAVMPNGDVVAGGIFTTAGGNPADNIARWNGATWSPLGTGTAGSHPGVYALKVLSNGDLIAGGSFATAGGIASPCFARWNGSSWSQVITTILNSPTTGPNIQRVAQMPNGDLVVGGQFTSIDSVAVAGIARWNGTTWSPLGAGTGPIVQSLAVLPNGDVVAGGWFPSFIAIWNGTVWLPLGGGTHTPVTSLGVLPSGDVIAGGSFLAIGGVPAMGVARWNGATWASLSSGAGLGGANDAVNATIAMPNGDLVVGGAFRTIGGIAAERIARWNGATWSPLGAGMNGPVHALTLMPNGDLVAGGYFNMAGGIPAMTVARWDGVSWSALGVGPVPKVVALQARPNGELFAATGEAWNGSILWRWDGISTWVPMVAAASGGVKWLDVFPNGDLMVAGTFTSVGGVPAENVARWNGTTWSALGLGTSTIHLYVTSRVRVMPDGSVLAAGMSFTGGSALHGLVRWNGTTWTQFGTALQGITTMLPLPDGDLLVGGTFDVLMPASGASAERLARWDGAEWTALGVGCDGPVTGLSAMPNGDVIVSGAFLRAGGVPSARLARMSTTCPATVASLGAGCTGSGGPNVLSPATLPWTGSTFRAVATGMPAQGFVVSVYGFTPVSIPIASVLPQGLPGCSVHTMPVHMQLMLPAAGRVDTQLAVPDSAALAGLVLHHFVAPFELDAAAQVVAITSTNALRLTLGSF